MYRPSGVLREVCDPALRIAFGFNGVVTNELREKMISEVGKATQVMDRSEARGLGPWSPSMHRQLSATDSVGECSMTGSSEGSRKQTDLLREGSKCPNIEKLLTGLFERIDMLGYRNTYSGMFGIAAGAGSQLVHTDRHADPRSLSVFVQLRGTRKIELVEFGTKFNSEYVPLVHTLSEGDMLVFNGPVPHRGLCNSPESLVLFISIDHADGVVQMDDVDPQGYEVQWSANEEHHAHVRNQFSPMLINYSHGHRFDELTYLLRKHFVYVCKQSLNDT